MDDKEILKRAIRMPDLCETHRRLLVEQSQYRPTEPWRALIIATQIALFQGATCDSDTHRKTGGDIKAIEKIGCLACWKPERFGQIIEAIGDSKDIGKIKALGESWVAQIPPPAAASPTPTGHARPAGDWLEIGPRTLVEATAHFERLRVPAGVPEDDFGRTILRQSYMAGFGAMATIATRLEGETPETRQALLRVLMQSVQEQGLALSDFDTPNG